jgi:hypothetical protein
MAISDKIFRFAGIYIRLALRRSAESARLCSVKPDPSGYAIPRTTARINGDSLSMVNTDNYCVAGWQLLPP